MSYETIQVDYEEEDILSIAIDRLENNNALNGALIDEVLDVIQNCDSQVRVIVVQGQNGVFCTGMDFNMFVESEFTEAQAHTFSANYMKLLTTFASIDKIIVAKLDGKVLAGGTGLVAAADLVYASPETTFSLSEALWGLLPANVMPYLVRRVGFQMAYRMTITTETIDAETAKTCNLVDDIIEDIDDRLLMKLARVRRLHPETIADLKKYFHMFTTVTEENCNVAINTLASLIMKPRIQQNVANFVNNGTFPWE